MLMSMGASKLAVGSEELVLKVSADSVVRQCLRGVLGDLQKRLCGRYRTQGWAGVELPPPLRSAVCWIGKGCCIGLCPRTATASVR